MSTFFVLSALVGCTLLALQTLLQCVGMGGFGEAAPDVDFGGDGAFDPPHGSGDGHPHSSSPLPKIVQFLSYQTIVAFLAFFGLAGLAAEQANVPPVGAGILAVGAGLLSMVVLTYVLKGFQSLQSDGSIRIHRAVGRPGRVYLRIPGEGAGVGKVTIQLQGRTVELAAKTYGPALAAGTPIAVQAVLDSRTVEVAATPAEAKIAV
jgi:hypothetical protein